MFEKVKFGKKKCDIMLEHEGHIYFSRDEIRKIDTVYNCEIYKACIKITLKNEKEYRFSFISQDECYKYFDLFTEWILK